MAYQILVVDDEPSLRAMVTDLLQRQGYNVTQAASCAQARQAWADARPDAVLLDVMLPDGDGFSLLAELRREGLDRLLAARMARRFEHRILPENPAARYPSERLAAEENVTNRLAEAFYRDHGVQRIERGLDLAPTTAGHPVMRTAYCIRREIGECLKEHPRLRGELWLERGRHRYRLEFDCVRCEMSLVDASEERNEKKPNK